MAEATKAEAPKADVKVSQADADAAAAAEHAAGFGLHLGQLYTFTPASGRPGVTGVLIRTHDLGAVVLQEGQEHSTFFPWASVYVVQPV